MIVEWYIYRDPLNATEAADCVWSAMEAAAERIHLGYGLVPMASLPYSYSDGRLNLWLKVEPDGL